MAFDKNLLLAAALLLLNIASQYVFAAPNFPQLSGRVVDQANIIDVMNERELKNLLQAHEEKTSNQVVVVTLASLENYDISDYGFQLARHWALGQKDINNGALLLVAPNERKVRIEVGYGLEGVLTDAFSHQIIQNNILPLFRVTDYQGGIKKGLIEILSLLETDPEIINNKKKALQKSSQKKQFSGIFLLGIFFLAPLLRKLNTRFGEKAMVVGSAVAGGFTWWLTLQIGFAILTALLFWVSSTGRAGAVSSGGYSSGGGMGGGGFSGGGGSFGGGGASGGW